MAQLIIPDETTTITFAVGAAQSIFPFAFAIFSKADLRVSVGGVELFQSDFTLTGTPLSGGGYQGGNVVLNVAVAAVTLKVWRRVVTARASNFAPAVAVPVISLDTALNRTTAIAQDLHRDVDRALAAIDAGYVPGTTAVSAFGATLVAAADGPAAAILIGAAAGSSGQVYETRAAAIAATVAATIHTVVLLGYASATDGVRAQYVRASSPPIYAGSWFRSADRFRADGVTDATNGGYWQYVPDERGANAKAFGAVADGAVGVARALTGTDNWAAIQQALDFSIYSAKCVCYLPAGDYLISKSLQLGWGTTPLSARLEGDGRRRRGESSNTGTAILCAYSDQMGLALNGVHAARVRGLTLIGKNFNWIESQNLGGATPSIFDLLATAWVDPSLSVNANSRYAPYAGIAVDAYCGAQTTPHYPDRTYPAFLGSPAQYGATQSSDYVFEDVEIVGFVVGFVNQPSNFDANGDFPRFENCVIEKCVYGVSVGNSQCRNLGLTGITTNAVHTNLTGIVHGVQDGKLQGKATNCQFSNCIQWIDHLDAATGGPFTFDSCYGEGVYRIGRWQSGGSAGKPLIFDQCVINFSGQTEGAPFARGRPTLMLDASEPNAITFIGGDYNNYLGVAMFGGRAADYRFEDGAKFTPASSPSTPVQRLFRNFMAGVAFEVLVAAPAPEIFSVSAARYSQTASIGTETLGDAIPLQRSHPICAWSRRARPLNDPGYILPVPRVWAAYSKSSLTSVVRSGLEVTLTFSALTDDTAYQNGWLPGCAIWDDDSKVWLRIHSRITTVVIATIITGYTYDGSTTTLAATFQPAVGNFYSGNALMFLPSDAAIGDTDSTLSLIANVGKANGDGSWLSAQIVAGDFIYANNTIDNWIGSNKGLIATVTNGAPGSLTLSGANKPTITQLRKPMGFFIQTAPANE